MTTLTSILKEMEERIHPPPVYRVFYPPEDYDGDEWSLGRSSPSADFKTELEAKEFLITKRNKRVPDWGQPHYVIVERRAGLFEEEFDRLIAALRKAIEVIEFDQTPDSKDLKDIAAILRGDR